MPWNFVQFCSSILSNITLLTGVFFRKPLCMPISCLFLVFFFSSVRSYGKVFYPFWIYFWIGWEIRIWSHFSKCIYIFVASFLRVVFYHMTHFFCIYSNEYYFHVYLSLWVNVCVVCYFSFYFISKHLCLLLNLLWALWGSFLEFTVILIIFNLINNIYIYIYKLCNYIILVHLVIYP